MAENRTHVYSPRLYYVIGFLGVLPAALFILGFICVFMCLKTMPVPTGWSYWDYSSLLFTFIFGPILFIITLVELFLIGWPKKLYLDKNALVIKKLLIFWEQAKLVPYFGMNDVLVQVVDILADFRYETHIKAVILRINLKDGKSIKLDFWSDKRYDQFLAELKERIAKSI
jgi:hypothetical protein